MKFGIHLPQFGRASGPDATRRAAEQAEALGYADIWVSDHLAIPKDAPYPPTAYIYEPLITLTWAAAATRTVGLGTSILVLPLRHPLPLARMLGCLDLMSGGRLTVGAAVGWLEPEFAAAGVPFAERGPRGDETIRMLRALWTEDPVTFEGKHIPAKLDEMRAMPQPGRHIPIWVGGNSPPALRRAINMGDGWHGSRPTPDGIRPLVTKLREARPEESFTISLRVHWDGLGDDLDEIKRLVAAYREMGVQHIMMQPRQATTDNWLKAAEKLWETVRAA